MFVIDLTFAKKSTKDEMHENVTEMGMWEFDHSGNLGHSSFEVFALVLGWQDKSSVKFDFRSQSVDCYLFKLYFGRKKNK